MKPLHLPLEGHDLLAVERFKDDTRHMAEFLILSIHCPLGRRGQYKRLFLTEDEYAGCGPWNARASFRSAATLQSSRGISCPTNPKNAAIDGRRTHRRI